MIRFLPQSLGFFIQYFPAAFLLYIPFTQDSFRFSRSKVIAFNTAGAILLSSLFPFILILFPTIGIDYYTNIFFLATVSMSLIVFSAMIQDAFIRKAVAISVSGFYSATLFMIRCLFQPLFPSLITGGFHIEDIGVIAIVGVALTYICYYVNRYSLRQFFKRFQPDEMRKETVIIFIELILYFMLIVVYMILFRSRSSYWTFVAPLFLTIMCLMILSYYLMFTEAVMKSVSDEVQRVQDMRIMQYQKIEREIEAARREQHDTRHHIANLYSLAQTGDMQKIVNYLNELSMNMNFMNSEIYCYNEAVNSCLQYYIDWAKNLNIECQVSVDVPRYFIDGNDLTILFGNILENAILASESVHGHKWLRVKAEMVGNSFAILIDNACSRVNTSGSYRPSQQWQSASAFKSMRLKNPYGLKAVEAIAVRYHGSAEFSFDDEKQTFTSRILLKDVMQ